MIEVVGNIGNRIVSNLIDSGVSNNYVAPIVFLNCFLNKINLEIVGLVQLATGTKKKVTKIVIHCPLEINGLNTFTILNVIALGSYDALIGMDWLTTHRVILDCYNKTYTCLYEKGNKVTIK